MLWQSDIKYGPYIPTVNGGKKRTYMVAFIDDATRLICHAEFYDNQRLPILEDCFRKAILKYGKPDAVYVDNGKVYVSRWFRVSCAKLGIRHLNTKAYSPESKGKIERFNSTMEEFLQEISLEKPKSLEELKQPEGKRIADFIRQNYLYSSKIAGFSQKLDTFSKRKEVTSKDVEELIKTIKSPEDKFTFCVSDKEYDRFLDEDKNTHIYEKALGSNAWYIQFPAFTPEIGSEFKRAIDKIGSPENKYLVIDLRNNTGGSTDSANDILDYLLPECESSRMVFKGGGINAYYSDAEYIKFKKIIIMVNEYSASSSEILTLGLKKNMKNVVIIGRTTYGKGVGQLTFEEKNKKYLLYLTSFNWDVKKTSI
jgi:hypothetical protein